MVIVLVGLLRRSGLLADQRLGGFDLAQDELVVLQTGVNVNLKGVVPRTFLSQSTFERGDPPLRLSQRRGRLQRPVHTRTGQLWVDVLMQRMGGTHAADMVIWTQPMTVVSLRGDALLLARLARVGRSARKIRSRVSCATRPAIYQVY